MAYSDQVVINHLLTSHGLTIPQCEGLLGELCPKGADFADIYFESSIVESWSLEESIVKSGSYEINQGVGCRVNQGEHTGFAYTDVIEAQEITRAVKAAGALIRQGVSTAFKVNPCHKVPRLYPHLNPIQGFTSAEKVALLQEIDRYARRQSPYITEVMVTLSASWTQVLIMATDGTLATDIRPLVRLSVTIIAEKVGEREQGFAGGGGRHDYDALFQPEVWQKMVQQAVQAALTNLEAKPAPVGAMNVVLGSGWPGVLLHEAVGHGLEGDFNRKETSAFSGRIGEQVASKLCTVVDDGTLLNRRGSLSIDDEGTPTQCTTLIENGRLVGYIHDKLSARQLKAKPTGNGRREAYNYLPLPRMTNTYLLPGPHTPEDVIASVDKGLYAVNFSGGQVDITSGKFVFVVNEAYLIENGKITTPVKGATLIGDGPSALMRVSMVANDLSLDSGIGVCGKDGQSVPVGVGQPTIRINQVTVGGTALAD